MDGTGTENAGATIAAASAIPASVPSTKAAGPGGHEGSSADASAPTLNQIRCRCLTNMDYHAAREGWLDQVHRWLMFAVILAGAVALVDAWPQAHVWGPVVGGVSGALDLTFDLSNRARGHAMFRRRYGDILAGAVRPNADLVEASASIDEISGEEEPCFNALYALCEDRAEKSVHGNVEYPCEIACYLRPLMNVCRFPGHDFRQSSGGRSLEAVSVEVALPDVAS